jgi:hypothetical protein
MQEKQNTEAMHDAELDWSTLPAGLAHLRNIAGQKAALVLSAVYGGGSVYVPRRFRPDHPLLMLLGAESAAKLAEHFGGDKLEVPKPDAVHRQLRARSIKARRAEGTSVAALVSEFNLSRRRILQILADNHGGRS